jgi:hypothetical protein
MARQQLGVAESAAKDDATKAYVDAVISPRSFAAVSANATLSGSTTYLVSGGASGTITLTLPTSPSNGSVIDLTRIDSNSGGTVNVVPGGTNTLSVGNPFVLRPGMGIRLIYRNSTGTWQAVLSLIANLSGLDGPTSSNTVSTLVSRDSAGRTQFVDPSAAQDAATKNYVDTQVTGTTSVLTTSGTTAVANTMVVVNLAGSGNINLPLAPADGTQIRFFRIGVTGSFLIISQSPDAVYPSTNTYTLTPGMGITLVYQASSQTWYPDDLNLSSLLAPTSVATANALMVRDTSGRSKVADPSAAQDIATKNYVDTLAPSRFIDGGTKTTAFTAVAGSSYVVNFTAGLGSVVLTLPTAPAQGTCIAFNRIDGNAYTSFALVTPGGTDTINGGGANYVLSTGSVTVIYQGTQWNILAVGMAGMGGLLGPSTNAAFPPNLMSRDSAGRSKVADPSAAQDIATKNYVDLTIARDPVVRALYR